MSLNRYQAPKILVVDDQPENLRVLAELLTSEDYSVQVARSGEQALKAIGKQKPDLILLDIDMPGMNGIEVCLRLKCAKETAAIPVIFVSALDQAEIKIMGLETGGVDYITKPFVADEVLARVQVHLEINRLNNALGRTVRMLEEKTDQMQILAATLIQDMRGELAALTTNSNLLIREVAATDEAKEIAGDLLESSQRLETIVSTLLLLAKSNDSDIEDYAESPDRHPESKVRDCNNLKVELPA